MLLLIMALLIADLLKSVAERNTDAEILTPQMMSVLDVGQEHHASRRRKRLIY